MTEDEIEVQAGYVIGIGASAGGLEAIEMFFDHVQPGSGAAFVVIQHLSPDFNSLMDQLLARHTSLEVRRAEDGMEVLPDRIYLIPPRHEMTMVDRRLRLTQRKKDKTPSLVIDLFFRSMAADVGPAAIGVILSGTGSDGHRGVRAIKDAGGLVLVQDPESAKFDGMPRAAIASDSADAVLAPWDMGPRLRSFLLHAVPVGGTDIAEADPAPLRRILDLLNRKRGVDFSQYKDRTILRRLSRRMAIAQVRDTNEYFDRLVESPAELDRLFRDLLINVTEFFRDPDAFDCVRRVLPRVVELAQEGLLRVWIPGCSTGEEAYSIAILLEELMAVDARLKGYKIFATDIAPDPLALASEGLFPHGIQDSMPANILSRYFEMTPEGYRVARRLRDRVVFAQHNLALDPPFTRIQIVSCRNLLIYMTPELQERVLHFLHFSLVPGGILFLGPSEVLGDLSPEFEQIDSKWRLYSKLRDVRLAVPDAPATSHRPERARVLPLQLPQRRAPHLDFDRVCSAFLTEFTPTCLILDEEGNVVHTFGETPQFLKMPAGQATLDIRRMLDGEARTALTTAMHGARQRRKSVSFTNVPFGEGELAVRTDLRVKYLPSGEHARSQALYLVMLGDPRRLGAGEAAEYDLPSESNERIKFLEHELQESKENLQATIEELETTNEELQSTNEELLASNEELQSTNEELHSVNEELYTVNAEHQNKIEELTELSQDVENLLKSIEVATVFLDRELCIRSFTPQIEGIIALLSTDIGRPIRHLTHELRGIDLHAVAQEVLATGNAVERETVDGSGVARLLRVLPYHVRNEVCGVVITLIDLTRVREAQQSLAESERRFQALVERLDQVFWTASPDGTEVMYLSPLAEELLDLPRIELEAGVEHWFQRVPPEERAEVRAEFLRGVAAGDLDIDFQMMPLEPEGTAQDPATDRWLHAKGFAVRDSDGRIERVVGFIRDVSRERFQQEKLQRLAIELESKAHTDALTGLLNRRGLESALTRELARARRGGHSVCVALVDLDDFKQVNDSLGHSTGDLVLHGATERMQRVLRPSDTLARIGGDEFIVLLPEARLAEAVRAAERLRLAIADNPISVSGEPLRLSASIGVSVVPPTIVSIEEIMDGTRQALAAGKRNGKNRVVAATDGTGNRATVGDDNDPRLRELTDDGVIHSVCQPIRNLVSGEVCGYEMLSRGPDGPYANPAEFLRLSLEKNMLNLVDLKCLRACVLGSRILQDCDNIHVNLYPSTLVDTPVARILGLLEDSGGPERFCVELSEQLFLGAPVYLKRAVRELRAAGVRIAIDDVGYGRSSIEALVLLEPDVIKIAREFVAEAPHDKGRRAGLERLVRATSELGDVLIAEGVEHEGERDLLMEFGVPLAQGFLWDRPVAPEQAAR